MNPTVTFQPGDVSIAVPTGTLISEAASLAGISALHLPCGGRGTCGKCTVQITKNSDRSASRRSAIACTTRITEAMTVWIEPKSHIAKSCIVADAAMEQQLHLSADHSPLCRKIMVQVSLPTIHDNYADMELLETALKRNFTFGILRCSRTLLQTLASTLREQNGNVTVTCYDDKKEMEIVAIEAGDRTSRNYGIACDIGTTTVSVRLVDLSSGTLLATESDYNGQLARGADVISRIEYGRTGERLEELRQLGLCTINNCIRTACGRANVDSRAVSCMAVAGNSTMVHFFLGLDARYLREQDRKSVV
jgi:uncharacterized 2Fe-2S/4Fe-4S cluster protein (DUF4445 family)